MTDEFKHMQQTTDVFGKYYWQCAVHRIKWLLKPFVDPPTSASCVAMETFCAVASQAVWSTDLLKETQAGTLHIQPYGSACALTTSVLLGNNCQQQQQTVHWVECL